MNRFVCFALCLAFVIPSLVSAQEEKHPQEALETAIPHAIKLLEGKKYKELLDGFVPPENLKQMKEAGFYEVVISKFGEGDKVKKILQALNEAKEMKPEFNEDKTQATFKSDKADSPLSTKEMKFVKIDKHWYIK